MKESHRKGVASHPGPESCVGSRKAAGESVDRGTCRLGIELRNNRDRSADVVPHGGRQHRRMCYRKHPQDSAQSETPGMYGNSTRENRETPSTPVVEGVTVRLEKALSQKSNTHVDGESDGRVVPTKCPNNSGKPPAEGMEGRRPTKENIGQATAPRTQSRTSASSDLLDVREATLRRQVSEVGAVCSNSARTDLCGGRWVNQRPYRDKRVFGPLSTDAIMHYDVFYQAMNTEYWCPKLVFPQPAKELSL